MDLNRLSGIPVDCDGKPLPAMVRNATKQAKVIPKEYEHLIPSKAIAISSFLETPLPNILSTISLLRPAASCIVHEEPSWTEDQLVSVSIPSTKWLADLDKGIGEAWPMGASSIQHPGSPNIRFPLWAGTFWTMLSDAIEEQKEWRCAVEWVNALTQGHETREVQMVFSRIPRNVPVWVLMTETERAGTSVSFFAEMLSDGLLAERHIDAFVAYLNIQMRRRQPSTPGIFVADLSLSVTLSNYLQIPAHKIQRCRPLLQYTAMFKTKAYRRLLFPARVGGKKNGHWIVFSVDFKKAEYSYGELYRRADSLVTHPFSYRSRKFFKICVL